MLSQKGDALSWSDFERYQGWDVGSGLYIMRYEIDELFDVLVGGVPDETPWYIYLRVNNEADDRIDIRTEDVSTFVEAHRNDVPKVIEPKPDGGGEPAPEEPDFSTLSEEQAAIRQAILEHNNHPTHWSTMWPVAVSSRWRHSPPHLWREAAPIKSPITGGRYTMSTRSRITG